MSDEARDEVKRSSAGLAFHIELEAESPTGMMPETLQKRLDSPKKEVTKEEIEEKFKKAEERRKLQEEEKSQKRAEHLHKVERTVEETKAKKKTELNSNNEGQ